jgi:hypothetical protein
MFVDFIAGITQATLVTIVGYPFDLVKTRMQATQYKSFLHCCKKIIAKEGYLTFYRGSLSPWCSHLLKRPIQYPVQEKLKTYKLNNYVNGAVGGMIGPVFGTPFQVIKVGMQTSNISKTSGQFIKYTFDNYGLKGFYRGFIPTVAKDCLFGASFIGHYYTLRDLFEKQNNIPWYVSSFISGATAHCLTWFMLIPIDYIKTIKQHPDETRPIQKIILDTMKTNGIRGFWKGVLPACLRTIPVSGIAMLGYEGIRKKFVC